MKLKEGDLITENGIMYVVERNWDGSLWGVSNNAEYEIEIDEDFVPDSVEQKLTIALIPNGLTYIAELLGGLMRVFSHRKAALETGQPFVIYTGCQGTQQYFSPAYGPPYRKLSTT